MTARPVILTGDTPTGQLHLGHYVGSVKRRVELQDSCECYFLLANYHAYTTRVDKPKEIRRDCIEIVRDYLAMGIDPKRSTIFLQSEIPAITELTFLFAMLLPFNRVMRNPTLKDEIKVKGLGENYSFGFPLYAVGQTADILSFRAHGVPVGEDQVPHLEMTREVARRFNQIYCGVSDQAEDDDHVKLGGVFPVPSADVGKVGRLVGIDGVNKMSKSLDNYVGIDEPAPQIFGKLMSVSDELMWRYLELLSRRSLKEIQALRQAVSEGRSHPMEVKKDLAQEIAARFQGEEAARAAREGFEQKFSRKELNVEELPVHRLARGGAEKLLLARALAEAKLAESATKARTLIGQGGVRINGEKVSDSRAELAPGEYVAQVGKLKAAKLVIE